MLNALIHLIHCNEWTRIHNYKKKSITIVKIKFISIMNTAFNINLIAFIFTYISRSQSKICWCQGATSCTLSTSRVNYSQRAWTRRSITRTRTRCPAAAEGTGATKHDCFYVPPFLTFYTLSESLIVFYK